MGGGGGVGGAGGGEGGEGLAEVLADVGDPRQDFRRSKDPSNQRDFLPDGPQVKGGEREEWRTADGRKARLGWTRGFGGRPRRVRGRRLAFKDPTSYQASRLIMRVWQWLRGGEACLRERSRGAAATLGSSLIFTRFRPELALPPSGPLLASPNDARIEGLPKDGQGGEAGRVGGGEGAGDVGDVVPREEREGRLEPEGVEEGGQGGTGCHIGRRQGTLFWK